MRLNISCYNVPAQSPIDSDASRNELSQNSSRKGKTLDSRVKLNSTRGITHEYVHSYFVNDAPSEWVPKSSSASANPNVSGFTSQSCKDLPRDTNVGDESLRGARNERNWK